MGTVNAIVSGHKTEVVREVKVVQKLNGTIKAALKDNKNLNNSIASEALSRILIFALVDLKVKRVEAIIKNSLVTSKFSSSILFIYSIYWSAISLIFIS